MKCDVAMTREIRSQVVARQLTWTKMAAGGFTSDWLGAIQVMSARRGSRIEKRGFVQEFRLENRSYPDVHDFSLRMQVIIAND